ncbi:hypothetical protein BDZ89DRAFT_1146892 [Hymenopellis radicata]|nr:hypothetical protein BDZ89DRAFT_1146892 [Hymenopellis radicata]
MSFPQPSLVPATPATHQLNTLDILENLLPLIPLSIPLAAHDDVLAPFGDDPSLLDDPKIPDEELWEQFLNSMMHRAFWGKSVGDLTAIMRRGKYGVEGFVRFLSLSDGPSTPIEDSSAPSSPDTFGFIDTRNFPVTPTPASIIRPFRGPPPPVPTLRPTVSPVLPTMTTTARDTISFAGDEDVDKLSPKEFLRLFKLTHIELGDDKKLERFNLHLVSDSVASEWFDTINPARKTVWTDVLDDFAARFPTASKAKETPAEIEKSMLMAALSEADVGEKNDKNEYKHVAFAAMLYRKATQAGIEKTKSSTIISVHDRLPGIVREKVRGEQTNWKTFTDDIAKLDMEFVRNEKRKRLEAQEESRRVVDKALQCRAPETPSKDLARTLATTSIGAGARQNITTNPFAPTARQGAPPPMNPPTGQQQPTCPRRQVRFIPEPTQAEKAIIRGHMATQVIPATPAEHAAAVRAWGTKYGVNTPVSPDTPFPLSPGTALPGSGECFDCGTTGHDTRGCTLPMLPILREIEWRRLCQWSRLRTARVFYTEDDLSWAFSSGNDYSNQGNGDGAVN